MGEVIMKIKVMPEDASMDMEKLKEEIMKSIPDYAKVNKTEIAPIAFGLKALMLYITMPDQSPDELMDKIAGIEGVGNATIDELSLI
ncbi:MAG: elongation factor 1-beta [Thermoplasmata archaeon]|nr:MAG: elongation factor 1-beta [Thermoplasmata archaeon]KAA0008890.1 MAG: elongation factor 1-beta [Thermoplasmata archaeon]